MSGASSSSRRSCGALLAPAVLRLALAVTFIWAGLGKVVATMPVTAEQAATLAAMGVRVGEGADAARPASPAGDPASNPDAAPASHSDARPTPPAPPAHSPIAPTPDERAVRPDAAAPAREAHDEQPPSAAAAQPAAGASQPGGSAAPSQRTVRRVWGLALRIHESANPGVDAAGAQRMKLWPAAIGSGNWPRYFAIAVVVAELGGGVLVGLGLLTRLGAFALAGVMLGAMWLDQIGPAVQAGGTVLWVLPAHGAWDVAAWRPLLWQFALLCCACAVVLLGAGAPSLDRALGWGQRGDDDDL